MTWFTTQQKLIHMDWQSTKIHTMPEIITIQDATQQIKAFWLKKLDTSLALSNKHDYYFQVQCAIFIADKPWCDFVVHANVIPETSCPELISNENLLGFPSMYI